MPPKRKNPESDEQTESQTISSTTGPTGATTTATAKGKRVKFTTVLSPVSYAEKKASSPKKERRKNAFGKVKADFVVSPSTPNGAAVNGTTSTTTATTANAKAATTTTTKKSTSTGTTQNEPPNISTIQVDGGESKKQASVPEPAPPPAPTAAVPVQDLSPSYKTRSLRNSRLPGINYDENSPFLTFRAIPKPLKKGTAVARSTRGMKAVQAPEVAPAPALPTARDDQLSDDELTRAASVLSSMTSKVVNITSRPEPEPGEGPGGEQEKEKQKEKKKEKDDRDIPTDKDQAPAEPTTPSKRHRGRPKGSTTRKAVTAAAPPPSFTLPPPTPQRTIILGEKVDSTPSDPKPRRGRKPAAAMVVARLPSTGASAPPEVVADDLAPPAESTRGRGRGRGRPRGSTRGRGGGRGLVMTRHLEGDDDVFLSPAKVSSSSIPAPTPALFQPQPKQAEPPPVAITPRPPRGPKYTGPVTELGVKILKKHVIGKMNGRGLKRLVGFEEEYGHVHHLLEQTVVAGEGNSMLIIGAKGVGKTTLVESAISALQKEYKGNFLTVRLSGLLQTDDKLALREIWRQLGVEMDLEEQGGQPKTSNFADTLTSILALLSHPDELEAAAEGDVAESGRKTSLSVIFILDEFDLFVTHLRQTLLYNLFDIAQARKAPIAVLGLSSRIDVVEGLEKRVKSRFSHRTVHMRLPQGMEQFWSIVRSGLDVDEEEVLERIKPGLRKKIGEKEKKYWREWNENLERLFEESKPFRSLLRKTYAVSKDVKTFWASYCLFPVAGLVGIKNPYLTDGMLVNGTVEEVKPPSAPPPPPVASQADGEDEAEIIEVTTVTPGKKREVPQTTALQVTLPPGYDPPISLRCPDNRLHILPALNELELSLLIAAARLDIISDTDTCNFNMAYEEYRSLASKVKIQNSISSAGVIGKGLWGREVAVGAWEGLGRWELLVPAVAGGQHGGGQAGGVGRECRMWRVDVGLREIGRWGGPGGGPLGGVLGRWCKEI